MYHVHKTIILVTVCSLTSTVVFIALLFIVGVLNQLSKDIFNICLTMHH